ARCSEPSASAGAEASVLSWRFSARIKSPTRGGRANSSPGSRFELPRFTTILVSESLNVPHVVNAGLGAMRGTRSFTCYRPIVTNGGRSNRRVTAPRRHDLASRQRTNSADPPRGNCAGGGLISFREFGREPRVDADVAQIGAGGRTRTGTSKAQGILSPRRLPFRHTRTFRLT